MRQWLLHPFGFTVMLMVALGVRLGAAYYFEQRLPVGKSFEFGDSDSYWYLGQQIAAGQPYELRSPNARVFRMPGYPVALAPLFWLYTPNAPPIVGRVQSALFGVATVALVAWWASVLFGKSAAAVAGWMATLYPGAIAMSAFVLSEAPFCPLLVLHLVCTTLAYRATTTKPAIVCAALAGAAAAAAVYMRPSWLLFLPFMATLGLLLDSQRQRISLIAVTSAAILAVCLVPWWVRNQRVTGHFVATTLQVGISLKDGLNPLADGASDLARADQFYLGEAPPQNESEWQVNRRHLHEAASWAIANPLRVLQLAGIKFLRMWNVVPNEPMFRSWFMKLSVGITYLPLLVLGIVGVQQFGRGRFEYWLCALPAVYFTLLHMVFVSSIRYREPAMFGLMVLAAGVLTRGKATLCTT